MSDIPASASVPPPLPSSSGGGAVTLLTNSKLLADLPLGTSVDLTVSTRLVRGVFNVSIGGEQARLTLNGGTLPPLTAGASLRFQVVPGTGGATTLRLLSVDGRQLPGVGNNNAGGGLPPSPGTPVGASGLLVPQAGGRPATTLTSAGVSLPTAPNPSSGLMATVVRPAVAATGGSPGLMPSPTPTPGLPGQGGTGMSTGGLPSNLPPGTQVPVRIASIGLPGGSDPVSLLPGGGTPSTVGASLLSGTVTAHPPGGNAVVRTAVGTLTVPAPSDLPVDTRITLEVIGKPLPPPPAMVSSLSPRPQGIGPAGWPAFSEALQVLEASDDTRIAAEMLMRTLPQGGPRLAAGLVVVAAGIRLGDGRGILSETSLKELEKAGRKDLARRLAGDLDKAVNTETERSAERVDWRAFTLPSFNNGAIEPIRLFVRRAGDDGGGGGPANQGGGGTDQRFLLDFNLTRLGRVQMDGLVRGAEKLFNLIIRTSAPLAAEARHAILGMFAEVGERVGTKGGVSFQAGGRWVEFSQAATTATRLEV